MWVAILITAAIAQSLVFMRRAWNHALDIGLSQQQLKKGLMNGVMISVLPTLPVLVVFLSLVPILGVPLPWSRLSVVGSAHYETYAASIALQTLGEELMPGGCSINGWIAAAWVMFLGGSVSVLWSACMLKPISMMYEKTEKMFDMGLVLALGSGCMAGVMAYVSVVYGLSKLQTNGVVFGISFLCGAILVHVLRKRPHAKWISDYLMAISMLVSMVTACFIF